MQKSTDTRAQRLVLLFESLRPSDLDRLGEYYAHNVAFKDPFNELVGLTGLQKIFGHMFKVLSEPRFLIHDVLSQEDQCFMSWTFEFHFKNSCTKQQVRGASHLTFDTQGKVCIHRDYWDAAEEFYEHLPLIGSLLRWLKKRLKTPQP